MKTTVRTSIFAAFAGGLLVGALGLASAAPPFPTPPKGGLPACKADLLACETELSACDEELAACLEGPRITFPGDGYTGAPLRYTDNGDGTFTDDNTGLMWEIKDSDDNIEDHTNPHDVTNRYTWSATGTAPDGTAFTEFLAELNSGIGFAGYTDWRLPTVKELQSLVDYSLPYPGPSVKPDPEGLPGAIEDDAYWSSTSFATIDARAWSVEFLYGYVHDLPKSTTPRHVRAVRGGQ